MNKLKPHADFFAFETNDLAKAETKNLSKRYNLLNGDWKFNAVGSGYEKGLAQICADYGVDAE